MTNAEWSREPVKSSRKLLPGSRISNQSSAFWQPSLTLVAVCFALMCNGFAWSQDAKTPDKDLHACLAVDSFFADEVWAKVGQQICLNCHTSNGDAGDSEFLLRDVSRLQLAARNKARRGNEMAFTKMAAKLEGNQSRLILKARGELDHGGEVVVKPGSEAERVLKKFVSRTLGGDRPNSPSDSKSDSKNGYTPPPFWSDIRMISATRLLRRVTLSLAGRLPSESERELVKNQGMIGLDHALDKLMDEDAFYDRLAEAFNDILLTRGYDGVPERVLGYRNFGETRGWVSKWDLSDAGDEKAQRQARYKLTDDYRESMLREPTELIKHIVRERRSFTEIVTADYIMVSPYTARGYGIYDEVAERFKDNTDWTEFIPVKLRNLTLRDGKPDQVTPTGMYPHAGLLTTFHYLRRYPTTETNRNRLRSRMVYSHFLGIDVMALAPRVTDAAAVDAAYEIPTMQAAECVVCHKTVDPIAGIFQDYYDTAAVQNFGPYMPRKGGWFTDMFGAGFEGEPLPDDQRWRAAQWLGERLAKDPRFATAMVGHAHTLLTGRKVLVPPQDIDDPMYSARRRAYHMQRMEIEQIAQAFIESEFDFKVAIKAWVASRFYRADGTDVAIGHPHRNAELHDIGLRHLLTPEQLERKIVAVFGRPWGRLKKHMAILYGGIDSKAITERLSDPSGAMGAIQRMMANEVACKNVAYDFSLAADQRRLFPNIESDVVPGKSNADDAKILAAIVHLHERILGQEIAPNDKEVQRTFDLFAGIIADAASQDKIDTHERYHCRAMTEDGPRSQDPDYTLRAWRAVVTYLLRQDAFLYE